MTAVSELNEQLLVITHQIRELDHAVAVARSRRKWSNLSLVFGPLLALLLYSMLWLPQVSSTLVRAVYIPAVPVALGFCVAAFALKAWPGGPRRKGGEYSDRETEGELELKLARLRDARKVMVANADVPAKVRRVAYKEDAYADIDHLRAESNRFRRVNNFLQGVLIIGSLAATGASGIAAELPVIRWIVLGVTFVVGISSGFMGYFKYKERSFYLQQTADAIEHEWEAVEVGVGRYKRIETEEERLDEFVEEVHRLKSEQKKRQQNLEQPPESRNPNE
jgi:MFS family permease